MRNTHIIKKLPVLRYQHRTGREKIRRIVHCGRYTDMERNDIMNESDFIEVLAQRKSHECVFCHHILPNIDSIVKYDYCYKGMGPAFITNYLNHRNTERERNSLIDEGASEADVNFLIIEYITCPQCQKTSITAYRPISGERIQIFPKYKGKIFPEYIPKQIRQDYEEACLIADLSPKASATLSRRCLQGMIRDFFGITKSKLVEEINEVSNTAGLSQSQKNALNALRQIGNIGAHPERDINLIVDIEPNEAQLMISLIEFFMQHWYIQRHEEEEMLNAIVGVAQQKQEIRDHH